MIESILLGLAGGAVGGSLVGGTIAWFTRRPRRDRAVAAGGTVNTDPVLNEHFDRAAAKWAKMHGQPAAAPLIANKLRLGHRVVQGRRSRRWSR